VFFFVLASALLALRLKTRLTFGERRLSSDDYISVLAWVSEKYSHQTHDLGLSGGILRSIDHRITHLSSHRFSAANSVARSVDIIAKGMVPYVCQTNLSVSGWITSFSTHVVGPSK
jgi:hypothetical protein